MRKLFAIVAMLGLCASAVAAQIDRVEPLSWWTGMKTPLQLMINGEGVGSFDRVRVEGGKGLKIKAVHTADSPNYLFVDVEVSAKAKPGTYTLVLGNGSEELRYPYKIEARSAGSAQRGSFTTADLIYLIVPDRFANGDPSNDSTPDTAEKAQRESPMGRHGGDIQGIIDHLDYIADLGATALWSTPLLGSDNPRGSYHGYACTDYYHIDPRYGSNELYREMVQKAHAKGIKVILDVVTNHSSTSHWWMKDLPFKDWVHVKDPYVNTNHTFSLGMDPNASKADIEIMEEGWFVRGMPDMNLDNPFMLKYFQQWAVWWIEYSGLDGFRVDTYFYNEKVPMSQWCAAVRAEYPMFNIVGECWSANPDMIAYWQADNPNNDGFNSNLPSIMDFPLRDAIDNALTPPRPAPEGVPAARGRRGGPDISAVYNALGHDFIYHDLSHMLLFLSNHDTARIGDVFGEDVGRMKIALTLLATLRGIPQLFYGDEMMFTTGNPRRDDGRLRMDFPGGWSGDAVDLFTPEGRLAAASDSTWAHAAELHDYARTLFRWRKGATAVQNGRTLHFIPQNNTYAYFRYDDAQTVFVFINNSETEATLPWTRCGEITSSLGEGRNVLTGEHCRPDDGTAVPAKSALVFDFRK
ncbi:MAG: glycoside hydrolase family 13 protein [Bacteroidales bacterium]|nr:glycoside hydrolase family 13 protein [Bacteroidales bacterium]